MMRTPTTTGGFMKEFLNGTILGAILSLVGLIVIAFIYGFSGRTPEIIEISLVVWAVTLISYFCGNAVCVGDE